MLLVNVNTAINTLLGKDCALRGGLHLQDTSLKEQNCPAPPTMHGATTTLNGRGTNQNPCIIIWVDAVLGALHANKRIPFNGKHGFRKSTGKTET